MNRSYKASKKSLSMKQNIKSWKQGTNRKLIAEPSNKISRSSRNGTLLT